MVDNWLGPAMGTGLFTGVHVDVEPYTTSAWQTDRAGVVGRYLGALGALDSIVSAAAPAAAKQTFYGQSRTELEQQLAQIGPAFAGQPGYAGIAIHDSVGYAALAP